jgi:hypothetical protein
LVAGALVRAHDDGLLRIGPQTTFRRGRTSNGTSGGVAIIDVVFAARQVNAENVVRAVPMVGA